MVKTIEREMDTGTAGLKGAVVTSRLIVILGFHNLATTSCAGSLSPITVSLQLRQQTLLAKTHSIQASLLGNLYTGVHVSLVQS